LAFILVYLSSGYLSPCCAFTAPHSTIFRSGTKIEYTTSTSTSVIKVATPSPPGCAKQSGCQGGPPWIASGSSVRMVAPTVIIACPTRTIPEWSSTCPSGWPFAQQAWHTPRACCRKERKLSTMFSSFEPEHPYLIRTTSVCKGKSSQGRETWPREYLRLREVVNRSKHRGLCAL
jgi:hypothetical protein